MTGCAPCGTAEVAQGKGRGVGCTSCARAACRAGVPTPAGISARVEPAPYSGAARRHLVRVVPAAPGTAAAEQVADEMLRGAAGVYTARQMRDKARRETPVSALAADGGHALDAEDWLTLHRLGALPARFRLHILYERLDDAERRVLIRWLDGARQREIAAELGMSQQRVSKIFAQAVVKCRDACVLYEGSALEGEFWWLVRQVEQAIYRPPERVWRHQRPPDRALVRSLADKGRGFLFFVNLW